MTFRGGLDDGAAPVHTLYVTSVCTFHEEVPEKRNYRAF